MKWAASAALLALVLSAVTLVAPSNAHPQAGSAGRVPLGAADNGRQVELQADQYLELRLEANLAAGYDWTVEDMDAAVLRQVGEPERKPLSPLLGAPEAVILRFAPQAAGQSPLVLAYRRPWEQAAPLQTFSLAVTAAGAYVGAAIPTAPAAPPAAAHTAAGSEATAALPAALNWCTEVGCTPVRDQGNCGSCWAFATAGALEQNIRIVDRLSKDLSEQYLLSCNSDGFDCGGGWWVHDYHWWKYITGEPGPGAVYEASFPYKALDLACNPPHEHHETISSWEYVGVSNAVPTVADLKQAIFDRGPIAASICVGTRFANYTGGVLLVGDVCTNTVNHGVVLVGWDDSLGTGGAWILRNSWGPDWGEDGYMNIAYGISNVGYGASYIVRGTMPHTPSAPGSLQAMSASTSRIDLSWIDTSSNESGFRIERSPNGVSSWLQVATVGVDVEAWSNTSLSLWTLYYYRVQAYNSYGASPYSNVAHAWTWPDPSTLDEHHYLPLVGRN